MVCADFSPSSMPQALRMRYFSTHLPQFGWEPVIVTTDPKYYETAVDPENERLLPPDLNIIRTRAFGAKWTRRMGVGDIGMRSLWYHWRELTDLCRRKAVDLLCFPVPPYVPMILGRLLHMRYGIPYVIDYGDPWVIEYYWTLPPSQRPPKWALAYAMARVLEPFALKRVSCVVGVSKKTTEAVVTRYPWLHGVNEAEIPHGGEPRDFQYLREHPRVNRLFEKGDGNIHLCYIGAYVSAMLPSLQALFGAVRIGLERAPGFFARLRLHFVGTSYAPEANARYAIQPIAQEAGIGHLVEEQPARVGYLDALQLLLDSHGLVVVGSDEAHYTPSKIFPYIMANRPLLAILHEESTAVDIARSNGIGQVVTFSGTHGAKEKAEEVYSALQQLIDSIDRVRPPVDTSAFEPHTTVAAARKLAQVFDRVVQPV